MNVSILRNPRLFALGVVIYGIPLLLPCWTSKEELHCIPLKANTKEIDILRARVAALYTAEARRQWRRIVTTILDPADFGDQSDLREQQIRIWQQDSRGIDLLEWRILDIRQCGPIAVARTKTWWRDRGASDEQKKRGTSDEDSWWIRNEQSWYQTHFPDERVSEYGKSLHEDPNDIVIRWIESPREEFQLVWRSDGAER